MGVQELLRLDEHATGTTTRIVNTALGRLENLHQRAHHRARGVELAATLTLRRSEACEEVLVHLTQQITCPLRAFRGEASGAEQVHQLAQAALVHAIAVVIVRQRALQGEVIGHQGLRGLVDELADGLELTAGVIRLALGVALQVVPAGLLSDPENVLLQVGVAVLQLLRDLLRGGAFLLQLRQEFETASVESIGHILEEH